MRIEDLKKAKAKMDEAASQYPVDEFVYMKGQWYRIRWASGDFESGKITVTHDMDDVIIEEINDGRDD